MRIEYFLIGMVGMAAITDISSRRISNLLVACGLIIALILQLTLPGAGGWHAWLFGVLTGFALFIPLYVLRGMAAGDVKLMAAVGAFAGPAAALKIALATFVIGGIWALAVIVFSGRMRDTWINLRALLAPVLMRASGIPAQITGMPRESVGRLPYGVAIALGTVSVTVFGHV